MIKKESEFRKWLELTGARTEGGRNTRISSLRRIQLNLPELGMPYNNLGEAWEADRFEALLKRLRKMRDDARDGGQDYQVLMPEAKKDPRKQVSSRIRYVVQYGQFLAETNSGSVTDADCIRQHALENYIKPARKEGREQVDVPASDVHAALGLVNAYPSVCQALGGRKLQRMAQVPEPTWTEPNPSSSTIFTFKLDPETAADTSGLEERGMANAETKEEPLPMNLILYGPPGTGKTYATAAKAVEMCGEQASKDRAELMKTYQRLVAEGRIEFVTFHQSMSYEDFVEGRQPTTESDGDEETTSAGFRLETVHGIFRRIAKRAETSRGRPSGDDAIRLEGRRFFKMSIGANKPSEEPRFKEAIKEECTLFGDEYDDIDWSDKKFEDREEIFKALGANDTEDVKDEKSPRVGMIDKFRNEFRKGDIIIASKGQKEFRAIGEIIGDYEYRPQGDRRAYSHRRAVRWLWVDETGGGVPVENNISDRQFARITIHPLDKDGLNIPVIERYINSQQTDGANEPEPFVLIIDEINRANISKVFGELITLLEPDKRLKQRNEIKVRLPYSGDEFGVPPNLHILGTMNTADRSIALLDVALRRRFAFREVMPDASLLAEASGKCGINLQRLLDTINERIEYLYDREHQIGHAYFMGCASRADVDDVMRDKVIPLLAEYFFEDWTKIAAVLGDLETHDGPISGGFLDRSALKAPPGLEDGDAAPRFRWRVRDEFDYAKLTG